MIKINEVVEFFIWWKVIRYFEKGCVVIFGGGIGNLYFIIDLVVVFWVIEIGVEVILKGIWVDGIYFSDLEKNIDVIKFDNISFVDVL